MHADARRRACRRRSIRIRAVRVSIPAGSAKISTSHSHSSPLAASFAAAACSSVHLAYCSAVSIVT